MPKPTRSTFAEVSTCCPGHPNAGTISEKSLKRIADAAVEAAAIAIFHRAFADAGAVIEQVNLVEEIEDVEPDRQIARFWNFKFMLDAQVHRVIRRQLVEIGKSGANAVAIRGIGMDRGIQPGVGNAGGSGVILGLIRMALR